MIRSEAQHILITPRGHPNAKTLGGVQPGDQIAWFLTVFPTGKAQTYPPYRLDFADASFFGATSVTVPDGGFSPFLPVRTIHGMSKYTVTIQGISPSDDPVIQTDDTFVITGFGRVPRQIAILWNTAQSSPSVTVDGTQGSFPLSVYPGDVVTFSDTSGSPQPFDIFIDYFSNSNVPSPFDGSIVIPSTTVQGNIASTDPCKVATDAAGLIYKMHFVLLSDTTKVSTTFELDVAQP